MGKTVGNIILNISTNFPYNAWLTRKFSDLPILPISILALPLGSPNFIPHCLLCYTIYVHEYTLIAEVFLTYLMFKLYWFTAPIYYSTVEEENTDESSAVEPEQHDDTGKDEQPMEQSDNVGDSTVSTEEAPDSSMFYNCNLLMNRMNVYTVQAEKITRIMF